MKEDMVQNLLRPLLMLCAFNFGSSVMFVSNRLQVHHARLRDSLVLSCAANGKLPVMQARWIDLAGGTSRLSQGSVSSSSGRLRFPKVTAELSGYYQCIGYVRLPRREVLIKVRHEIQVHDEYKNETGCHMGQVVKDLRCCADVCRPGTFSPGGEFRNCIPCDFDSYTDQHGSPFCLSCPPGKTTYRRGSSSADDCGVSWKIYALLFGLTTLTSLILFIRTSQAWSSEQSIRSHIFEDKLSRFFQPQEAKVLASPHSGASFSARLAKPRSSKASREEKRPLLAPLEAITKEAKGTQTDISALIRSIHRSVQTDPSTPPPPPPGRPTKLGDKEPTAASVAKVRAATEQETMFEELLAKTARNARRLDRRKNTPQPSHHSGRLFNPATSNHRRTQVSRLRSRQPLKSTMVWRSPNQSPHSKSRVNAAPAAPLSPLAEETAVRLHSRPNLRSSRHDFNTTFHKLPAWHSPPEDRRMTSYNNLGSPQYDVKRNAKHFVRAGSYESSGSNQSVPLYRPHHLRPRRPVWDSTLATGGRDVQPASIAVSPTRDYQMARRYWKEAPPEGRFAACPHHTEEHGIPPRGAISSPGVRKRAGDEHMFRRFGSHTAWVTDEYAKHKQQGPGYYGSP